MLRYLKGTAEYCLMFNGYKTSEVELIGYTDADWGGDLNDRKSQSSYLFEVCGGLISWISKKQDVVALSTTEAEYIAASLATQELLWLRRLLNELGFVQEEAIVLYEDNMGAIEVSKNPKFHGRMKHIDIRHNFLRNVVETVKLCYCETNEQLADIMTKTIPKVHFEDLRCKIGVLKPMM